MEEKISAEIENAKIQKVYDLWGRHTPAFRFGDTDAIAITARTEEGKEVNGLFIFSLKPDGTFSVVTPNRVSRARRKRLARFLKYYHIAENAEKYNLKKGIAEWKGKKVEVAKSNGKYHIFVPETLMPELRKAELRKAELRKPELRKAELRRAG